jgi:hypothetical protein
MQTVFLAGCIARQHRVSQGFSCISMVADSLLVTLTLMLVLQCRSQQNRVTQFWQLITDLGLNIGFRLPQMTPLQRLNGLTKMHKH